MSSNIFTLRTVTSGGALNQFLPDFESLDIGPVFSAPGTVSIKYPANGVNYNLLANDVEIAVLLNGVEVPELRCVIEATEGDNASHASDGAVWTFTCRTLLGKLDQAIVYPMNWPLTDPPNYPFAGASVGTILINLIGAAQIRGSLPWLTYDFFGNIDSNGVAWPSLVDLSFDAGTTLLDVLASLVDNGLVEVQMVGRVLRAFVPGSLGSDKSVGSNPLRFTIGRDIKESPRKSTTREIGTTVLVASGDGAYIERHADSGSMTAWGRRERYLSLNNAAADSLDLLGDTFIETVKTPKLEVTHGLFFEANENPKPVTDFMVGDWALSDVGLGWERYRIKQWVLSVDNAGLVTGSVTLNQLIDERISQLNRRLSNIENGSTNPGSTDEVDDGKAPAVPTGMTATSNIYLNGTRMRAVVTLDWTDVTTNYDGTTMSDFSAYTVRWRYASDASTLWRSVRITTDSLGYFENLDTNAAIKWQVEAHDKFGRSSGYTADQNHTTAGDTTPPSKTSAPIVTSNVGTLRVFWDGLNFAAAAMEGDVAGVEVHLGPNGTYTPDNTTIKDYLPAGFVGGTTITAGLSYGTEYFARLVAVDTSGNRSTPSDLTSTSHATLTQVVNVEIGTGQVGLANTTFSDVSNLIDDGNFELGSVRNTRALALAGTHLVFDGTTASVGTYSLRSDNWVSATTESLLLQAALPVKPGERIFGAADYKVTATVPGGSLVRLSVKWLNAAGSYIDNTGAVNNVDYGLSDSSLTTADGNWHSRITATSQVAPVNAASMEIWLFALSRTAGTIWVDAVEVRRQIDTLLIQDAAITTAKIANLAVTNAQINDLSVGKLTTGTLGADIIVGARIKTANTGARVELSSAGLAAFDSGGNQTVNIASADGSVAIIGQLSSGTSGRRVIINPTSTFLPEIRFYASSGTNYGFINGFSPGGTPTAVFLGLNSGQYTASGTTVNHRIYMADTLMTVEIIKSSTQTQWGGGFDIGDTTLYGSVEQVGTTTSKPFFNLDMGNGYTSIGWDGSTDGTDSWMNFFSNGEMSGIGRYQGFASLNPNSTFRSSWQWFSGFSSQTLGYGATMLNSINPGGAYYNDNSEHPTTKMSSRTATGYVITTNDSSGAAQATFGAWSEWVTRATS